MFPISSITKNFLALHRFLTFWLYSSPDSLRRLFSCQAFKDERGPGQVLSSPPQGWGGSAGWSAQGQVGVSQRQERSRLRPDLSHLHTEVAVLWLKPVQSQGETAESQSQPVPWQNFRFKLVFYLYVPHTSWIEKLVWRKKGWKRPLFLRIG